jgi:hypothetical protein
MKNEAFRQYTSSRLDAHDDVLGLDTRSRQAALPGTQEAALEHLAAGSGARRKPPVKDAAAVVWYYESAGQAKGPVSALDIRQLLEVRKISGETLLWTEDLGDWTPAREIAAFRPLVAE